MKIAEQDIVKLVEESLGIRPEQFGLLRVHQVDRDWFESGDKRAIKVSPLTKEENIFYVEAQHVKKM